MTKTQPQGHTPGPWKADFLGPKGIGITSGCVIVAETVPYREQGFVVEDREQLRVNAKFIAAACTSYDKHCGPRAVECAEADLLGEALRALRETATQCEAWIKDAGGCDHSVGICMCEEIAQVARAGAVLAKASGERT